MSILNTLYRIGTLARVNLSHKVSLQSNNKIHNIQVNIFYRCKCSQLDPTRAITFSFARCSDNTEEENITEAKTPDAPKVAPRQIVSVETSIKYMNSDGKKLFIYGCVQTFYSELKRLLVAV